MTHAAAATRGARRLRVAGAGGAAEARVLLCHAAGLTSAELLARTNDELAPAAAARLEEVLARRERGEPVAYITGTVGFYGRTFAVSPAVLVPRPETEHLAEGAVAELRARGPRARRVADIGTGSGILAITLACEVPEAEVYATDASPDALALASANARALGVAERVHFYEGDLAAPLPGRMRFDVLVANLPYVPSDDVPRAPDPVSFEPLLAVDGGRDGLVLYRRLFAQLPGILAPGAVVFCEAAPPTIDGLARLAGAALRGAHVEIGEDYAGLERYVAVHPAG